MRGARLGLAGVLLAATCASSGIPAGEVQASSAARAGYRISLPPLVRIPVAVRPQTVAAGFRLAREPVPELVTRISRYAYCGDAVDSAQRCIDDGSLTLYHPAGVSTLAGHNYLGWDWMDDLPVGRKVVIGSGSLKGTYRVFGHGQSRRGSQGGRFPAVGLGASVALQTCTSTGTGFSFLRRETGN